MKIYKNLWAGYETYFVKKRQDKRCAYGPEIIYYNGKWEYRDKDEVHTIQMGLLNDAWWLHWNCGDRIFLHDEVGVLEICAEMERLLVPSDDVFRLWRDGAFEREKE